MSRRAYLIAFALGLLLGAIALASCDTRHIVEACTPLDSITVGDSLIVFHKTPCR